MYRKILILLFIPYLPLSVNAELNDQGLLSVISIIDKTIKVLSTDPAKINNPQKSDEKEGSEKNSMLINMAKTLGKLSYSRIQCGETDVLGEFTQRISMVPSQYQDAMRNGFQQGFDQSKDSVSLLSEEECKRLTKSRQLKPITPTVDKPKPITQKTPVKPAEKVAKPVKKVDPSLRQLRLANMAGQLAFKKEFCGDKHVINRDYNEIIAKLPKELQSKGKEIYWKGYKQGEKMNKNLSAEKC